MLLAIDIGNSDTTLGLFDGAELREQWRLTTSAQRTSDETRVLIMQLVLAAGVERAAITGVVLCSVVPPVTQGIVDACDMAFGVTPLVVDGASGLPITLNVDDPTSVGPDLVVNAFAGAQIYHRDCIVVDLGTANTYQCITAEGLFFGCVIQPGVRTSAAALFAKTAMLPNTALSTPTRVIGTNTVDCIRSGVVYGSADSIDGIIRRIKQEWPRPHPPYVVVTGGLAETFRSFCDEFDAVDPALTLKGLRMAHAFLSND